MSNLRVSHPLETPTTKRKSQSCMRSWYRYDPTLSSVEARLNKLSPLHLAAEGLVNEDYATHKQKVELLIQHGANVNAKASNQNTPLHETAGGMCLGLSDPNIEVIETLVHAGAQWNAKNGDGKTPLQIAQKNHPSWCNNPVIQKRLVVLSR